MKKKIVESLVIFAIVATMCMQVEAASNKVINLTPHQVWTGDMNETRTGKYSYVQAECNAVYPISGTDNFSKIQVRILNESNVIIMNDSYIRLTEGDGLKSIDIKEGYMDTETVSFQFRGNSSDAAKANVGYYGK